MPRSSRELARYRKAVTSLFALGFVLGVVFLIPRLPRDTEITTLALRLGVGLVIGGVIVRVVARYLGAMTAPPNTQAAETVEAEETEVVYTCVVCGTRVRLERAGTGKAPRHCAEPMEPAVLAKPS